MYGKSIHMNFVFQQEVSDENNNILAYLLVYLLAFRCFSNYRFSSTLYIYVRKVEKTEIIYGEWRYQIENFLVFN